MDTHFTHHGKRRLQQRSIPIEVLEIIQDFGTSSRSRGADRFYLNKESRRELQRRFRRSPLLKHYERYLNIYVVISDGGTVITASRRTKRFKRDISINNYR